MTDKHERARLNDLFADLEIDLVPPDPPSISNTYTQDLPPRGPQATSLVCPYLRIEWDEALQTSFPDPANTCHKPQKAQPVCLSHQEQVCLSGSYQECRVYTQAGPVDRLPEDMRANPSGPNWLRSGRGRFLLLLVTFVLVSALLGVFRLLLG